LIPPQTTARSIKKVQCKKSRGKNIDKDAKETLTEWLFSENHFDFPYPSLKVLLPHLPPTPVLSYVYFFVRKKDVWLPPQVWN
jgi:hypothetical protein